ncbi:ArsR/SmtB family transcription factor [Flexithrix dorotheae]|uniref:ArsR/SmtB family transcription factor n=1 Tax=Flexithrix dorotheae TaxID=70993 RepID=UPI00037F7F88|nr:metalloregulator ArsR/SmtB family transcription factor [Flexithrix dorotheae]
MEKLSTRFDAETLLKVAEILKTIAHPVRLSILELLENKEKLTVSELMKGTGIEQSLLSHHLIKMKDKGVLKSEREGKNIFYTLADKHIVNIFDCMEGCSIIK